MPRHFVPIDTYLEQNKARPLLFLEYGYNRGTLYVAKTDDDVCLEPGLLQGLENYETDRSDGDAMAPTLKARFLRFLRAVLALHLLFLADNIGIQDNIGMRGMQGNVGMGWVRAYYIHYYIHYKSL